MEILIIGAGMGGLALAALLRQRGIGCTVVDRATDFAQAGYMLTLYPMGARVLHGLGVFGEFEKRSSPFDAYEVFNGRSELLHRFDLTPISTDFGYTGQILRSDLLEILRMAAPDVPLRMGLSLEHVEISGDCVNVRFGDGSTASYDAVIGADGIHSKTRRIIFGEDSDHETGWGLWVWLTKYAVPENTVREYWGKGRFIGTYPTPTATGAVAAGPKELIEPDAVGSNGLRVRELFSEMEGDASAIVETFPAKTDGLLFRRFADYRSHRWVHKRIALLGDAACAFLPTAGVGASMAIESAAVMADELSRTNAALIPHALRLYEKRRRARVESAQDDSRKLAAWMATDSAPLIWTRDYFLRHADAESIIDNVAKSLREPI